MSKLKYTLLNEPKVKSARYVIRMVATTCRQSISFPEIEVYCSEDDLITFLPKFIEFLKDEEREYFDYDFDPANYMEYSKEMDYHADGRFNMMYELRDVLYVSESGQRFTVSGFDV